MSDANTVEIEIGPTRSTKFAQLTAAHAAFLVDTGKEKKGSRALFRFPSQNHEDISYLLHDASSIRKLEVRHEGKAYSRNEFLRLLWSEQAEREQAQRRRAFEEAGSWWPLPDSELCSLVQNAGWDIEEDEPMDPADRQSLLDALCGSGFREPLWVERTLAVISSLDTLEYYYVGRAVEERHNVRAYTIEQEIRWAIDLHVGARNRSSLDPEDGVALVLTSPDCCDVCTRLYREPGGKTPRLFYAAELAPPGSNAGKALADWLPTAPPLHLSCSCYSAGWFGVSLIPQEFGFPRNYSPVVTRLPSRRREPL